MTGRENATPRLAPSGFFVLRTPFCRSKRWLRGATGWKRLTRWMTPRAWKRLWRRDRSRLRDRLLAAVARPELRDAVSTVCGRGRGARHLAEGAGR